MGWWNVSIYFLFAFVAGYGGDGEGGIMLETRQCDVESV